MSLNVTERDQEQKRVVNVQEVQEDPFCPSKMKAWQKVGLEDNT